MLFYVHHSRIKCSELALLLDFCCSPTSYTSAASTLSPSIQVPPFICSISHVWKFWASFTDRTPTAIGRLHTVYGPVVRFGPNDLSFNTARAVTDVYRSGWPKGTMYRAFQTLPVTGLFSEMDDEKLARRKRMFALGFGMPYIRDLEPVIDSRYAFLRRQLDGYAKSGEVFDLRRPITYCIVDILGELAFGEALGNQETSDPAKIPPVSEALYAALLSGQIPALIPFGKWVRRMLEKLPAVASGRARLVQFAVKNIRAGSERPETGRQDVLRMIMAAKEEKTGQTLSMPGILAESFTLIVGGTHTTGNALHILFANLARSPEALKRFVSEVDEKLPALVEGQAACGIAGLEEKLDFVNACVRESFRKDTVGTFNMPRRVPDGGAVVDGHFVAGGTDVSVNSHAFHHNPAIWGSDHALFDPWRWYDGRAKDLSPLVIPFGVGRRACVGQNLARTNILKMSTTLLRAYDFQFVSAEERMKVVPHGDSHLETPLMVRCKLRGQKFAG